jgi:ABC-type branched-subunit amino acid transport system ATPase component
MHEQQPARSPAQSSEKPDPFAGIDQDIVAQMREFTRLHEQQESRETAVFKVRINKEALRVSLPQAHNPTERGMIEMFLKFPEEIEFQPGVTLIVGENGSGKTTISRAFALALEAQINADWSMGQSIQQLGWKKDARSRSDAVEAFQTAKADARARAAGQQHTGLRSLGKDLEIAQAGFAPVLSSAIEVADHTSDGQTENFIDVAALKGEATAREASGFLANTMVSLEDHMMAAERHEAAQPKMSFDAARDEIAARMAQNGSTRQFIDKALKRKIEGESADQRGRRILFMDEVFEGMSPMRQKAVNRELEELTKAAEGSEYDPNKPRATIGLPTNSLKLYESDMPRIDTRFPGWGIFRPSEHPGYPPEDYEDMQAVSQQS